MIYFQHEVASFLAIGIGLVTVQHCLGGTKDLPVVDFTMVVVVVFFFFSTWKI